MRVLLCQIRSFYVKPHERNYGDRRKNLIHRVPSFRVTRGHWNRHRSIRYLWLPITDW